MLQCQFYNPTGIFLWSLALRNSSIASAVKYWVNFGKSASEALKISNILWFLILTPYPSHQNACPRVVSLFKSSVSLACQPLHHSTCAIQEDLIAYSTSWKFIKTDVDCHFGFIWLGWSRTASKRHLQFWCHLWEPCIYWKYDILFVLFFVSKLTLWMHLANDVDCNEVNMYVRAFVIWIDGICLKLLLWWSVRSLG